MKDLFTWPAEGSALCTEMVSGPEDCVEAGHRDGSDWLWGVWARLKDSVLKECF